MQKQGLTLTFPTLPSTISKVESIDRAVRLFGFVEVSSIVMIEGVEELQSHFDSHPDLLRQIAHTAVFTGRFAQGLTKALNVSQDWTRLAFSAGFIHAMGRLVLLNVQPDRYETLAEAGTMPLPDTEAEAHAFGENYRTLAPRAAEHWGLPERVCSVLQVAAGLSPGARPDSASVPTWRTAPGRRACRTTTGFFADAMAEVVTWTGANGETVNGILHYPLDYDPDRAYPMMTVIHGGPSGVDLDAWSLGWTVYAPLLAQRDAFVFRPNYHGSGHHGLDFVESVKGRYYELEVPDIVSGIDSLASAGTVDRDFLGVMGWSNGAILTTQLTLEHPELFRVAAPGAGDVNWTSDYGNCAFGVRFDRSYFKGAPWEYTEHYIQKSPLFEMPEVQTPILIHHGTEDRAVPYEQGWEYYRALQQIGNAPVRFLSYPGEPHGLGELSHQRRKVEEDLQWIDTYLFGKTSMQARVDDRLLADDAPLSLLKSADSPARTDGHYGTRVDGTLSPSKR